MADKDSEETESLSSDLIEEMDRQLGELTPEESSFLRKVWAAALATAKSPTAKILRDEAVNTIPAGVSGAIVGFPVGLFASFLDPNIERGIDPGDVGKSSKLVNNQLQDAGYGVLTGALLAMAGYIGYRVFSKRHEIKEFMQRRKEYEPVAPNDIERGIELVEISKPQRPLTIPPIVENLAQFNHKTVLLGKQWPDNTFSVYEFSVYKKIPPVNTQVCISPDDLIKCAKNDDLKKEDLQVGLKLGVTANKIISKGVVDLSAPEVITPPKPKAGPSRGR